MNLDWIIHSSYVPFFEDAAVLRLPFFPVLIKVASKEDMVSLGASIALGKIQGYCVTILYQFDVRLRRGARVEKQEKFPARRKRSTLTRSSLLEEWLKLT